MDARGTDSTAAVDHLPHPPILFCLLPGQVIVFDDHRHAWNHVQGDRCSEGSCFLLVVEPHTVHSMTVQTDSEGAN